MNFSDFDLHPDLLDGIDALNYKSPTPIQAQAIPVILAGKDLVGVAQTGTGKTGAFILPVLSQILDSNISNQTQALVVVPTRELALQIDQVIQAYSYFAGISSMAIFGGGDGKAFTQEKTALTGGADIIIATPGRLIAHINMGYVDFSKLRFLILDEADRMLDMGFQADLLNIIGKVNPQRQTLLFSATMPPQVLKFAKTLLRNPEMISIALSKPAEGVTQSAYNVSENQKIALVAHLLKDRVGQRILIFGSTKQSVNSLYLKLRTRNMHVAYISSDLEQEQREKVMLEFRNKSVDILVATDVLSRGIDVDGIELVINFDVPRDPEDYVHRIGRTARADRKGGAITLISPTDAGKFVRIEKLIGKTVQRIDLPFEAIPDRKPSTSPPSRTNHSRPAPKSDHTGGAKQQDQKKRHFQKKKPTGGPPGS